MNKGMQWEIPDENGRRLAQLGRTLDLSSVIRKIVRRHDLLLELETRGGASNITRKLQAEFELLEQRLRDAQAGADLDPLLLLT